MSSSNSPCAACKYLRRKCSPECVFAPYFPPDNPQKFAYVHKVFGASNVAKLLGELNAAQREDAVKSLAYEAEARLRDPVYGCVGFISVLQQRLKTIQNELGNAKKELATYIGPQAFQSMPPGLGPHGMMGQQHHQGNLYGSTVFPYGNMPPPATMAGIAGPPHPHGGVVIREPTNHHHHQQQQQQQMLEAQQLAVAMAAREQQEMFGGYEQHQQHQHQHQQQEFLRFNGGDQGFEMGSVSGSGFDNQQAEMSPSLALGSFDSAYLLQMQQSQGQTHQQLQAQLILQTQQQAQTHQPSQQHHQHQLQTESADGGRVGPSC